MIDAFRKVDEVLLNAVQGITDLITVTGLINVDFADVKTIMSNMGMALMGTGRSAGDHRAVQAAQAAISSPLLEDISINGATGILINITGGPNLTLAEVNEAACLIQEAAHDDANIIFGSVIDANMGEEVKITVIATGFDRPVDADLREQSAMAPRGQMALPVSGAMAAPTGGNVPSVGGMGGSGMGGSGGGQGGGPRGGGRISAPMARVEEPMVAAELGGPPADGAPVRRRSQTSMPLPQMTAVAPVAPTGAAFAARDERPDLTPPYGTAIPPRGASPSVPRLHPGLPTEENEIDIPTFLRRNPHLE
jgi:hypothetical protein